MEFLVLVEKHAYPVNSEKIYLYQETLCETSFTRCSVRRRNASDHVEWHSNREDTPIVPSEQQKKNQKQLKINGDIPELVPKGKAIVDHQQNDIFRCWDKSKYSKTSVRSQLIESTFKRLR